MNCFQKCAKCPPPNEYIRLFDITERTGVRKHKTGRICQKCGTELHDTIVHFGEKGEHDSPYNWKAAAEAAENADIILCLGSSLKVHKLICMLGSSYTILIGKMLPLILCLMLVQLLSKEVNTGIIIPK